MQTVRRVYIYLITFISLVILLQGASNLLRLLLEVILGMAQSQYIMGGSNYPRDQFSLFGALTLASGVVWVIHWLLAQRAVSPTNPAAEQERASVLRKLLIYAVLFITLFQIFFAALGLFSSILQAIPFTNLQNLRNGLTATIPDILVYGLAWFYYRYVRNTDTAITPERGGGATVRRWYYYLVNYATVSALIFAISDLARYIWRTTTGPQETVLISGSYISPVVTDDIAMIIVSAGFWFWHWIPVQRLVASSIDEQHAVLRKVFLYGIVLQTVATTIASLGFLLYNTLRLIIGNNPIAGTGTSTLTAIGDPLMNAVVYGTFWLYFARVITGDALLVADEPPRQANIRRFYYYLISIVSLAVLSGGIATMLRLLFDLWLGGSVTTTLTRQAWGDEISLVATLIIVGGSFWVYNWLRLQRQAMAPDGEPDRQSVIRRIYLYLILFASIISLLGSTAYLLYQIFLNIGQTFSRSLLSDMSWALGAFITGAIMLAYHLRIMLGDQHARALMVAPVMITPTTPEAATMIVFVKSSNAATLNTAIAELQKALPDGTQIESFPVANVQPADIQAWLSNRPSPPAAATPPSTQSQGPINQAPLPTG